MDSSTSSVVTVVARKLNKLNAATHVWSKAGDLKTSRYGHNVIFDGRHFLVVGRQWNNKDGEVYAQK